jgi:hypothetical protein
LPSSQEYHPGAVYRGTYVPSIKAVVVCMYVCMYVCMPII